MAESAESSLMAQRRDLIQPRPSLAVLESGRTLRSRTRESTKESLARSCKRMRNGSAASSSSRSDLWKEQRSKETNNMDPRVRRAAYGYLFGKELPDSEQLTGVFLHAVRAFLDLRNCLVHPSIARHVLKYGEMPNLEHVSQTHDTTPLGILRSWADIIPRQTKSVFKKMMRKHSHQPNDDFQGLDPVLLGHAHLFLFERAVEKKLGKEQYAVRALLELLQCGVSPEVAKQVIKTGRQTKYVQRPGSIWSRTTLTNRILSKAEAERLDGEWRTRNDFEWLEWSAESTPGPSGPNTPDEWLSFEQPLVTHELDFKHLNDFFQLTEGYGSSTVKTLPSVQPRRI